MSIILRALREARGMIETERAAFVDCHTLPNGGLEPDDQAIRQEYDDVLALIRDAVEAAESAKRQRKDPEPEIAFLLRVADARQQIIDGMIAERCAKQDAEMPRPLADWHEDDGAVVWWRFLVDEPAWIGTPLDDDWPGYHTHWTPHPKLPERER